MGLERLLERRRGQHRTMLTILHLNERDLVVEVRVALKMGLAASLSWWIATAAGRPQPVFAGLVGLVAMSGDPFGALTSTFARILGVFVGVGVGLAVLQIDAGATVLVALALFIGTLAGIALRVGDRANIQPAVSALFVVGVGKSGALSAGIDRLWETAIGAAVTIVVVTFLWPPDPVREVRFQLDRVRHELAQDFAAIAEDLATGSRSTEDRLEAVRSRSLDAVREVFDLPQARRALRLNPLRRHDGPELDRLERRVNLAARCYRHARAIARDVVDERVVDDSLAAAVRALAGAADAALRGEDPTRYLAASEQALAGSSHAVLVAQLRQLQADLAAA
jgi:uncharacterized membrane protein YgaE (UPF0421/DUF939 family)